MTEQHRRHFKRGSMQDVGTTLLLQTGAPTATSLVINVASGLVYEGPSSIEIPTVASSSSTASFNRTIDVSVSVSVVLLVICVIGLAILVHFKQCKTNSCGFCRRMLPCCKGRKKKVLAPRGMTEFHDPYIYKFPFATFEDTSSVAHSSFTLHFPNQPSPRHIQTFTSKTPQYTTSPSIISDRGIITTSAFNANNVHPSISNPKAQDAISLITLPSFVHLDRSKSNASSKLGPQRPASSYSPSAKRLSVISIKKSLEVARGKAVPPVPPIFATASRESTSNSPKDHTPISDSGKLPSSDDSGVPPTEAPEATRNVESRVSQVTEYDEDGDSVLSNGTLNQLLLFPLPSSSLPIVPPRIDIPLSSPLQDSYLDSDDDDGMDSSETVVPVTRATES